MGKFGKLIKKRVEENHEQSQKFIDSQVLQVLDEDSPITIDDALDSVTSYINRKQWVGAISDLLAAQKNRLSIEDYTGTSNDMAAKDELKVPLKKIRRALAFED